MKRPFLHDCAGYTITHAVRFAFLGLAGGIAAAEYGDWIWMLTAVSIALAVIILRRNYSQIIVVAFLCIGFLYWQGVHPAAPSAWSPDEYRTIRGIIVDQPAIQDGKSRFVLQCRAGSIKTSVRVFCTFPVNVQKGNQIKAEGVLRRIRPPGNPGEFDFQEYYAHRSTFYGMTLTDPASIVAEPSKIWAGNRLIQGCVERSRRAISASLRPKQAVLLEGMLLGFQQDFSDEDMAMFQKSGMIHILSVSGFHVGFVMLGGIWLAELLRLQKRSRFLFLSLLLCGYGFLCGWPIPFIRAALMAWLALLAGYYGRGRQMMNAVCVAGLFILAFNPAALFEISFQLTFLATVGLAWAAGHYPPGQTDAKWKTWLAASAAPQIFVLPAAIYYFNLVSVVSVAANLILVPVSGGAVILGFLGILAGQIHPLLASFFLLPAGMLTEIIFQGAAFFANLPGAYFWLAKPQAAAVAGGYAGIILLSLNVDGLRRNIFRWIGAGLVAVMLLNMIMPGTWRNRGKLEIVFLDVGQGDCTFIKTPAGHTMLIDGGGSQTYKVGKQVVLPYLRRSGYHHLDLVIASHDHQDHIGGLTEVLAEMPSLIVAAPAGSAAERLEAFGPVMEVSGSCSFVFDESTRIYWWTPKTTSESTDADNENSLVAAVESGGFRLLLTGDAGAEEQEQILSVGDFDPAAVVVKVPHHGSRYACSEAFLQKVSPRLAVVSAGERNRFNHPHAEMLAAYRRRNIEIFRTDQDGAVQMMKDGRCLTVRTWRSQRQERIWL